MERREIEGTRIIVPLGNGRSIVVQRNMNEGYNEVYIDVVPCELSSRPTHDSDYVANCQQIAVVGGYCRAYDVDRFYVYIWDDESEDYSHSFTIKDKGAKNDKEDKTDEA